jgi:hypothetical protein
MENALLDSTLRYEQEAQVVRCIVSYSGNLITRQTRILVSNDLEPLIDTIASMRQHKGELG